MKFISYDSKKQEECETQINSSNLETINKFIQTWVTEFLKRSLQESKEYSYSFFMWDKIIKQSLVVGNPWSCFSAITNNRLDGLLCLSFKNQKLKIEYIATAPWNYYKDGKMRRIGSGLIVYTIRYSIGLGCDGEFYLDALPDAEKFYKSIGMDETGNINKAKLKEFKMPKSKAHSFNEGFTKYLIN